MTTHRDTEARRVTGSVKWFDPTRGFGFIVANEGGPDILLHANVLRNFGQGSVCDGARLDVRVQDTERGLQTVEVLDILPPEHAVDPAQAAPSEYAHIPLEPARVKWFDKSKGFGFANVFGLSEDIFVHMEVLRRSGFSELQPGEAIALRVIVGDRGRMAVAIAAWELAARSN